ncbi:MAG: hypothetical protein HOH66_08895 [Rhodospirillaceae bacterium]|nr:hypothetical protein [Rhodospirillaceae bacterium]
MSLAPQSPDRNEILADALRAHAAGDLDGAEGGYGLLMRADPGDSDALFFRAVAAFQRGRAEKAIELCRFALRAPRFSPDFEARLADLLDANDGVGEVSARTFLRRNRLERHVLKGWLPETPPFGPDSELLTLGSCFAEELRKYLAEKRRLSRLIFVPPGLNNTFALRQFIAWSLTGEAATEAYWYDERDGGGALKWTPDQERESYGRIFRAAGGFVLTIGLAEVWEDIETGGVFWRGVPKSQFDEARHRCRVSTVEENAANLRAILSLLRTHCGDAPIVLTLSPVPLKATFGDRSCITADCVSKSILRVAIDQVMADGLPGVHYWPSFEIVKWLGCHLPRAMYGDDGNPRHVSRDTVAMILDAFLRHYFKDGPGR